VSALRRVVPGILLVLGLVLASCAPAPRPQPSPPPAPGPATPPPPHLTLSKASFAELPGWVGDDPALAVPALLKSCRSLVAGSGSGIEGSAADWQPVCAAAAALPPGDANAARRFFETMFTPWHATNGDTAEGLFTGYYEIALRGSRRPGGRYTVPLYHRPADLVTADLGQFRPSLKGQRIAGRLKGSRLVSYDDRVAIEAGSLDHRGLEFLWVDDPVDAFFLGVQGSGRVTLPNGSVVRVGYDGSNGRPYVSIGHVLAETGVPVDQISLSFLRQWIREHPGEGQALMDRNPSYVFFREMLAEGPLGSEGVALTPGRSLAVDPAFIPYGVPIWLDTSDTVNAGSRLQRLMVAQDTGGAIRGPVRGDIFFGFGPDAERHAGGMKGRGEWWLLLPATVQPQPTSP
jgi:membrane-bound lytic murein transglycosylase A